jgi:protein gp37
MKQAHRFSGAGKAYEGLTKQTKAGPQWTGKVVPVESVLLEPLSWGKPRRVFVNSMSDLFHEDVPTRFIDRVFAVMALCPQHVFQILTKRPERMRQYVAQVLDRKCVTRIAIAAERIRPGGAHTPEWLRNHAYQPASEVSPPLPNVWLGVSVENQQYADERIPLLLQTPAALRFISAEPLLGPLDLQPAVRYAPIDWVIVGGESGPGARPFDLAWARSIVQQCQAAGVACFVKQVGAKPVFEGTPVGVFEGYDYEDPKGGDPSEWPEDLRVREFPGVRQ